MQSTLWPELHKLYGHGNDVHCVCASPDGEVIATACKGNDVTQSAIRVWETKNWTQVALLPCHKYTVIQMAFSHDSRYLLRYECATYADRHIVRVCGGERDLTELRGLHVT